ncbi:Enolase-phosphatase-like protein [Emericellopsis cladophorae]|uniref:Enolase-phosphatase E1 n=1 Tax=Emericellopsis cladophorae TaxID=2686198 RepID=A0A9Q0BBZ5_9HYPO|nr:Enolase-phosphatase-like protein [Emericellopsis cladophorae]KAI6779196.1 Enolase-phosphatase-like protein [Emericellopsis cladophorae]
MADFKVLLLDIEGTVCPISFVKVVLFPHALEALPGVLERQWNDPNFAQYRDAFPEEYRDDQGALEQHVRDLVNKDVKMPYLKALQGYLWEAGYASGQIKAPLFPDVAPFMTESQAKGKKVMIYSSGSVPAQKLLFAHTDAEPSDLTPLISDWFDTVNAGPKTSVSSYKTILSTHPDVSPANWLFLSDNLKEVDAALTAGMRSLPVSRPGNPAIPEDHPLFTVAVSDFSTLSQ